VSTDAVGSPACPTAIAECGLRHAYDRLPVVGLFVAVALVLLIAGVCSSIASHLARRFLRLWKTEM
jgi:hypothetical protein